MSSSQIGFLWNAHVVDISLEYLHFLHRVCVFLNRVPSFGISVGRYDTVSVTRPSTHSSTNAERTDAVSKDIFQLWHLALPKNWSMEHSFELI